MINRPLTLALFNTQQENKHRYRKYTREHTVEMHRKIRNKNIQ